MDELPIRQRLWEFCVENTAILLVCGFGDDEIVVGGGGVGGNARCFAATASLLSLRSPHSLFACLTARTTGLLLWALLVILPVARYFVAFSPVPLSSPQLTLAPLAGFRMTNRRDANNLFGDNRTAADNLAR
ncbi:hypothetical protein Aduo_011166 [Ancylostoma duodenale]